MVEADPYETVEVSDDWDNWLSQRMLAPKYWIPGDWNEDWDQNPWLNWSVAQQAQLQWTLEFPGTHSYDCFSGSTPWDTGHGIGMASYTACPGGVCNATYQHVPTSRFDTDFQYQMNYPVTVGGVLMERYYRFVMGPNNALPGSATRFAPKAKICLNGGTTQRPWPGPRYMRGRAPRPAVVIPMPEMFAPAEPAFVETRTAPRPYRLARSLKPYQLPALEVEVSAGYRSNLRGTAHDVLPPGRGERERKVKAPRRMALRFLAALYDATTEAKDIIDAIWQAIPAKKRPKHIKSLSDRSYYIWSHMGDVNLRHAIENVLYNHYEDKIYGRIFGTVGQRAPYGVMLGNRPKPPPARWMFK